MISLPAILPLRSGRRGRLFRDHASHENHVTSSLFNVGSVACCRHSLLLNRVAAGTRLVSFVSWAIWKQFMWGAWRAA